jgi:hypothetical protein
LCLKRQKVIPGSLENRNFCEREIRIMLSISLFILRNINLYHLCVQGRVLGKINIYVDSNETWVILCIIFLCLYHAPIHILFNYDFSFFSLNLSYISYYNTWHAFCIRISVKIFNMLTKLDSRNVENTDKIVGFPHPDETPISTAHAPFLPWLISRSLL